MLTLHKLAVGFPRSPKQPQTNPARRTLLITCLASSLILSALPGCDDAKMETEDDVEPRGTRQLGISISDRTDGDFDTAFSQATATGMQFTSLSVSWDNVESAPGVYGMNPDFLSIANAYYGATGVALLIGLNPIDTNNDRRPDWLQGETWDSPAVINAYNAMLDWAMPKIAGVDLVALSIGNEIDATLANDTQWNQYRIFYKSTAAHAKTLRAGLRVGSKVTYGGMVQSQAYADSLNVDTDVVLTTYYPLNGDFTIKSPSVVVDVFASIVTRYPNRKIIFAEYGAPSSPNCGSSESRQAEFVRNAFTAWDKHVDAIEAVEFTWMHDISQSALDTYEQYYGLSNPCFLEYLGRLGLKSANGDDKPAWTALTEEAESRGW